MKTAMGKAGRGIGISVLLVAVSLRLKLLTVSKNELKDTSENHGDSTKEEVGSRNGSKRCVFRQTLFIWTHVSQLLTGKASVLPSEQTKDGRLVRNQETEKTKQCWVTQSLRQITTSRCWLEKETLILLGCDGNCHLTAKWFTHASSVVFHVFVVDL